MLMLREAQNPEEERQGEGQMDNDGQEWK